jgi:uncharacterized iron-regulated membrane protein
MPMPASGLYGRWRRRRPVMVQQIPSPASPTGTGGAPSKAGLSSGIIATLAGGGLLLVFMLQNRDDVTL